MSEIVEMYQTLRDLRGINPDDECPECSGTGYKSYPSTAVFMGGIGGQTITESVCDRCWGSGRKSQPWPSWKKAINRERTDHSEIARLTRDLSEAREKLLTYGWHHHGCRLVAPGSYQGDDEKYCDCGWAAVRAALEEGKP